MTKPDHDILEVVDPQGGDNIPLTVTGAIAMLKGNVLVNRLCSKYWGQALEAVKLRLDANTNFEQGNLQNAVDMYSKAIHLGKMALLKHCMG